jgi:hypothetical protein
MLSSFASDDYSDGDAENEENDPVVHSFGPFGANLLPRFASFSADTSVGPIGPSHRRRRAPVTSQSPQRLSSESIRFKESPVKNHVINQLAFSRLHSLPLSAIHRNLPAELKACITDSDDEDKDEKSTPAHELTKQDLKKMMDDIPCVGEIPRSGKDAAGQPLENEFYYVPEMDTNDARRETVTSGMRGSGLRSVRKQHKVGPLSFHSLAQPLALYPLDMPAYSVTAILLEAPTCLVAILLMDLTTCVTSTLGGINE